MPLALQSKMSICVKDLPVTKKTEEVGMEFGGRSLIGAAWIAEAWQRFFSVDTEMRSLSWKPEYNIFPSLMFGVWVS
jgi:hypothetical protein